MPDGTREKGILQCNDERSLCRSLLLEVAHSGSIKSESEKEMFEYVVCLVVYV